MTAALNRALQNRTDPFSSVLLVAGAAGEHQREWAQVRAGVPWGGVGGVAPPRVPPPGPHLPRQLPGPGPAHLHAQLLQGYEQLPALNSDVAPF